MTDRVVVDRLLRMRAPGATVLSVYLTVPSDPNALRSLDASLDDLFAAVEAQVAQEDRSRYRSLRADMDAVRDATAAHSRGWLGHGVALFASRDLGALEEVRLPPGVPDRAVAGTHPHLRPLLAALEWSPTYYVAVVDRRNAWLFRVGEEDVAMLDRLEGESLRSPSHAGWYGLEEYRIRERAAQLARHHYRAAASAVEALLRAHGPGPLVVGGHEETVTEFLALLPCALRPHIVGTFAIDPHTMTPARVREAAAPLVARWEEQRGRRLLDETLEHAAHGMAVTGLEACAAAVNQSAVDLLFAVDDGPVPGFVCDHCGALVIREQICPTCRQPLRPVTDVVDEMVVAVIDGGGRVQPVRTAAPLDGDRVAARLRFPIPPG